jgi:phosphonate transport system substrate-binding protein
MMMPVRPLPLPAWPGRLCRWLIGIGIGAGVVIGIGAAAAQTRADPAAIEIAVLPYFSQRTLLDQYEPLRAFVEARLRRPTYLATAHDYRTFVQRTQRREYAFVITGPHLGRLAQVDAGYRPLLGWKSQLQGVFLVRTDSGVHALSDLRDRSIGTPPALAVTTMLGQAALAEAGLSADAVKAVPQPSHNAAALAVVHGEQAAALVWTKTMAAIDPHLRSQLRPIATTAILPTASLFLASPGLPEDQAAALRDALLAFSDTAEGKAFLAKSDYEGLIPIQPDDLVYLDRFLALTRQALAGAPR